MGNGAGDKTIFISKSDYSQLGFQSSTGLSYDVPSSIHSLTLYDETGTTEQKTIDLIESSGDSVLSSGKLRGLIESYGYQAPSPDGDGSTTKIGVYPDMLGSIGSSGLYLC